MKKIKQQKGVSLLELMLVLIIITGILITVTRFYSSSSEGRKLTDASDQLGIIQTAGNRWLLTHADFNTGITSKDTFKDFVERNLLPSNYYGIDDTTKKPKNIINPWGGNLTVLFSQTGMLVNLNSVPKNSAEKLQQQYKNILCQTTEANPKLSCSKKTSGGSGNGDGGGGNPTCNIAFDFVSACEES